VPVWTRDSTSQAPKVVYTPDDPAAAQCAALIFDPNDSHYPWTMRLAAIGDGVTTQQGGEDLLRANGGLIED
jgi:hypothetical protein